MAEFILVACPFCSGANLELQNRHTPAFWITCDDCGAEMHGDCIGDGPREGPFSYSASPSGPYEATLEGLPPNYRAAALNAVAKWNRRDFSPMAIAASVVTQIATSAQPQEPVGYISSETLAELLHDNSGEYKITVPHDLMNDDQFPIYVSADAHPSPADEPAGEIWRDGLGRVTPKPAHADAVFEAEGSDDG